MGKNEKNKQEVGAQDEVERVVLLHGATGSYVDLIGLEKALVHAGYEVHNWDYPSTTMLIKDCAEHLYQKHISPSFNQSAQKTHFVGFSMGGLVAEEIIRTHQPVSLGRVVTLGTPYWGSDVSDFMSSNMVNRQYYGFTFGPAGQELTTAFRHAVMNNASPLPYELGCIGGDENKAYFISRNLFQDKPNDGRVALESTKHPDMKDHIIVHADHGQLPDDQDAQEATINFLKHGSFKPQP